jgi:glycosyltransferase involved in cell wall biosynthesis
MARVLYISYTGLLQPLGESQVFGYLRLLAEQHQITLLSYERKEDLDNQARNEHLKEQVSAVGIEWVQRRYHKRFSFLATFYDICSGLLASLIITRNRRIDIVHCRSYIPAVIGNVLKNVRGTRFIFDMRGFWADERVEGGIWSANSQIYRLAKWCESAFFRNADIIISLTHAGATEVRKLPCLSDRQPEIQIITTSTDLDRFEPDAAQKQDKSFVLGYVGSIGTWYLFDEVLRAFKQLQRELPDAKFLIVNRAENAEIRERLAAHHLDGNTCELLSAEYADMPKLIARMNAAAFFIKPSFSKRASAPTRLGEFLASGVPCLSNTGVGDVEDILTTERTGICVSNFDESTLYEAVNRLISLSREKGIEARCREAAIKHFSLVSGAKRYSRIYDSLT